MLNRYSAPAAIAPPTHGPAEQTEHGQPGIDPDQVDGRWQHARRHGAAQHAERLGQHHHSQRARVEHPGREAAGGAVVVGDQHHGQRGAQDERRGQRHPAAVLQPVQRGPDQRGDHRERRDGDQQVQRHLALALARWPRRRTGYWPAPPPSRSRRRSWPSPDRSARSARTCRRRRRWRRGGTGRTSCEPISRLRCAAARVTVTRWPCRLARAARRGARSVVAAVRGCVSSSGGSQRLALGHRGLRAVRRRYADAVAWVVGHAGVLLTGVAGGRGG